MDERIPLSIKLITGFSISGFLFSGYLSAITLFSGTCAVRESCPYFLSWPVCVYGFIFYSMLTVFSILIIKKRVDLHKGMIAVAGVSFAGILFSGYFSAIQLPALMHNGFGAYTFGVPTCLLGLIVYMIIFATVTIALAHRRRY